MKKRIGWISMLLWGTCALAQPMDQEDLIRIMPPPPAPVLKVEAEKPIELRSLDVRVRIRGLQAETTQTMVFHNPNVRQLAGDLQFPLPDGATVSGYALDVQGRMVDGVVVGKQKARVILEAEQRRRVDPGLVEHVRGNQFNTRVFPIPPQGQRTIRVTYVSDLRFAGEDAVYELPLPRETRIPELGIELSIAKGPVKPEMGAFGNLTLKDWNDQWHAETRIQDAESLGDLTLRLPKLPRSWSATESFEGETFVALIDRPEAASVSHLMPAPKRIALAWDASGSRSRDAVQKEISLLRGVLEAWPDTGVDLMVLRNRAEPVVSFEDQAKLLAYLDTLPLDGGTDLSQADFRQSARPHPDTAFWLLVSDGLHTLGEGLPAFDSLPVYALSAETAKDMAVLRFIAAATQGRVFDGTRAKPQDLIAGILDSSRLNVEVADPEGVLSDIQQQQDPVSGVLRVYAKVRREGTVALVYRRNGEEVLRRSFPVTAEEAEEGGLLARAWAAQKALALSVFPEENAGELRQLGNRYKLVTPGTSLLVLESLDQYLRYEVEPPASWPEMRQQYVTSRKNRRTEEAKSVEDKLDTVAGWWKERVEWWERDFDHAGVKKRVKAVSSGEPERRGLLGFLGFGRRQNVIEGLNTESAADVAAVMVVDAEEAIPADADAFGGGGGLMADRQETLESNATEASSTAATVALQAWSPDTPYLKAIRKGEEASVYLRYLEQREDYASSPAFFLDAAGEVMTSDREKGLRILSNLAEMKLENAALLRVYAWRLQEAGELDRSIELLERVRALRPDEPQSHRDLALALILRYEKTADFADAERAGKLLYEVITGQWARFEQIELQACIELNRLIVRVPEKKRVAFDYVDERLRKNLDVDLRVVLSWDADNTDIDLHVGEPSGEVAYYSHNRTLIGGYVSRDFTQGYGPEDYFVRKALPGAYEIKCKYYGSSQQTLIGPATVTATVFTNYGRPDEKRQVITLRLDKPEDMVRIGTAQVGTSTPVVTQIRKEDLKAVQKGDSPREVMERLGLPQRKQTDGVQVFEYTLADGGVGRIAFGPGVIWVRVVVESAEIDLL